jgi:hypothetical protein
MYFLGADLLETGNNNEGVQLLLRIFKTFGKRRCLDRTYLVLGEYF